MRQFKIKSAKRTHPEPLTRLRFWIRLVDNEDDSLCADAYVTDLTSWISMAEMQSNVAVVLSSSFFGFYAHAGFLAALEHLGIQPIAYSGTSAGALVAAFACAGADSRQIQTRLQSLKRSDFWDPDYRSLLFGTLTGFRNWKGLLKGEKFKNLVTTFLPKQTFEECVRPCLIVATNITQRKKFTFSSGSLVDAICASSSVPFLFKPYKIGTDLFIDGGYVDKTPILSLQMAIKPDVIIVHHIVSSSLSKPVRLDTPFLGFKINRVALDMSRESCYLSQLDCLEIETCKIIEIRSNPPRIAPRSLDQGFEAYEYCREKTLSEMRRWV